VTERLAHSRYDMRTAAFSGGKVHDF